MTPDAEIVEQRFLRHVPLPIITMSSRSQEDCLSTSDRQRPLPFSTQSAETGQT